MSFDDDVRDEPFGQKALRGQQTGQDATPSVPATADDDATSPQAPAPPTSSQDAVTGHFLPGNPHRFDSEAARAARRQRGKNRPRRITAEAIALKLLDTSYVRRLKKRLDSGHLPPALEAVILRLAFRLPEGGDEPGDLAAVITQRWKASKP